MIKHIWIVSLIICIISSFIMVHIESRIPESSVNNLGAAILWSIVFITNTSGDYSSISNITKILALLIVSSIGCLISTLLSNIPEKFKSDKNYNYHCKIEDIQEDIVKVEEQIDKLIVDNNLSFDESVDKFKNLMDELNDLEEKIKNLNDHDNTKN